MILLLSCINTKRYLLKNIRFYWFIHLDYDKSGLNWEEENKGEACLKLVKSLDVPEA